MKASKEELDKVREDLKNPQYTHQIGLLLNTLIEWGAYPAISSPRHILAHMNKNLVVWPACLPKDPAPNKPLSRLERLLEAWRLGQKNDDPVMRLFREAFTLKHVIPTPKKANSLSKTVIAKVRRFSMDPNYMDGHWQQLLALVVAGAMMNPPAVFCFVQLSKQKWSEN